MYIYIMPIRIADIDAHEYLSIVCLLLRINVPVILLFSNQEGRFFCESTNAFRNQDMT